MRKILIFILWILCEFRFWIFNFRISNFKQIEYLFINSKNVKFRFSSVQFLIDWWSNSAINMFKFYIWL